MIVIYNISIKRVGISKSRLLNKSMRLISQDGSQFKKNVPKIRVVEKGQCTLGRQGRRRLSDGRGWK